MMPVGLPNVVISSVAGVRFLPRPGPSQPQLVPDLTSAPEHAHGLVPQASCLRNRLFFLNELT